MKAQYDLVIVGAGSGGYIAAIRAGQLGLSVACIESNPYAAPDGQARPGGTCLNVGCIPSKALLASSHLYEQVVHHTAEHGITTGGAAIEVDKMIDRKDGVVSKMAKGIEYLFKKNKVDFIKARARFVGMQDGVYSLEVSAENSVQEISAGNVIIATGSKPRQLPGTRIDNAIICDNAGALDFREVPKRLCVVGAGVIGLELGSVWRRLGADVTLLDAMPDFLPGCDTAVSKEMLKLMSGQGLKFDLGVSIDSIALSGGGVQISYRDRAGAAKELACDKVIVAIGRVPNTDGLGIEAIGLELDQRGYVPVDEHCRTILPNLFAIGDVVRGPMLAHKAEEEGIMVAEIVAGQSGQVNYAAIPFIIYTSPEAAWVGKTEQELAREGRAFKSGQFPFSANGRALGHGDAQGFVKVLADAESDLVLGVHIVSSLASEMIGEAAMALEFSASSEDIARICHAHPTLYEAIREASLAVDKRALNI
ncbi:dihydrolipoyl dehydrogenase [Massilia oculi]|jgi:dihydrolipoamide dehydrogenase|uniref:Dihydrolipoyl dehydrogenase n=1 Tax=Massilia oculi TaxID=945844 RepID=A0A2S2DCL1_9BURK|nr:MULTISPECIES: dihydrolipoyl dehydrogenase [Massilia]AWL03077.1 dihydrolipoyl dehydrogenase [Massilia oculi]MDN4040073.1 dihydrolipoyl dehydrogenase [Massilia sp. YIM B02443]QYG02710.1 dihydrolipoyl dehydrogenase [Massilia sp. NP310]